MSEGKRVSGLVEELAPMRMSPQAIRVALMAGVLANPAIFSEAKDFGYPFPKAAELAARAMAIADAALKAMGVEEPDKHAASLPHEPFALLEPVAVTDSPGATPWIGHWVGCDPGSPYGHIRLANGDVHYVKLSTIRSAAKR